MESGKDVAQWKEFRNGKEKKIEPDEHFSAQ